jgi:transcriptional regulator, propionate catabolism operon regulatory protein
MPFPFLIGMVSMDHSECTDALPGKPTRSLRIVVLICHLRMVLPPSRLAREVQGVLPMEGIPADISVVDMPIADAVQYARNLERKGEVDLFICTGATGAYLKKHVGSPVVLIPVSDYDILRVLEEARRMADRVAVLSYRQIDHQLDAVQPLLTISLAQDAYTTLQEAEASVARLAQAGYQVVVGSSMITEIAEQAGLTGVLITSRNAIRQALQDAMDILQAAHAETAKRERLNSLLRHLTDGVAAIDPEGRIQAINPAMARMLGVAADEGIGRPLAALDPQLNVPQLMTGAAVEEGQIVRLGGRSVFVKAAPIVENGQRTGTALTFQDTMAVQRADRQIRRSTRASRFAARYHLSQVVATSSVMLSLLDLAQRYAKTDSTILIHGESGTGKELVAQGIHNASRRAAGPFVAINCASFPESLLESELFGYEEGAFSGSRKGGKPGLFELAHTGTIFLDEIGDMPLSLQTRLLRVLQEREVVRLGGTEPTPVDVRIVAATHRNLRAQIADGKFREDLYYRINILRLKLPALRERREDIAALAFSIAGDIARRNDLQQDTDAWVRPLLPYLESYPWHGNIRELENALERMVLVMMSNETMDFTNQAQVRVLVRSILDDEAVLPLECASFDHGLKAMAKSSELQLIRKVVQECGGSLERASKRLGISRTTIWRRLNATQESDK